MLNKPPHFTIAIFAIWIAFLMPNISQAQQDSVPISATDSIYDLRVYARVLVDSMGTYTFDEVRALPDSLFVNLREEDSFDGQVTVWCKLYINYLHEKKADYILFTEKTDKVTLEVHQKDRTVSQQISGFVIPHSQKPVKLGSHQDAKFLLHLEPHENYALIAKFESPTGVPMKTDLKLAFIDKWKLDYYEANYYFRFALGLVLGFFGVMMLYNLLAGLIMGQTVYLYYSLYIFGALLYIVLSFGFLTNTIIGEVIQLYVFLRSFIAVLCILGYILFTQKFLNTTTRMPLWHKILSYLKYFLFFQAIWLLVVIPITVQEVYYRKVVALSMIFSQVVFFSFIVKTILSKEKLVIDRYYIFGALFFCGATVFFSYAIFTKVTNINNAIAVEAFGVGAEILIFSLGLRHKMKVEEKEKLLAQEEVATILQNQKEKLEIQVRERTAELQEANKSIKFEKEKSEELLLNILPAQVAAELKASSHAEPRTYEQVTVLFTDFRGFTQSTSSMSPNVLIGILDECFCKFDQIMEQYGLEKIKTIGDAYMAVSGLPAHNPQHAANAALAALAIRNYITSWQEQHRMAAAGFDPWDIRIGLHSGAVVAGVVGEKKFAYDIWGDTVNTAARMEGSGTAAKVNISEETKLLLEAHASQKWHFEYRGALEAKGKGKIEMYYLEKEGFGGSLIG